MFICFSSHLLLTVLFYSCVMHLYPFRSKILAKNTGSPELRGSQALSGYDIFPLRSFASLPAARIKRPVTTGLCQAIFLPAISPRATSGLSQRTCSLCLFGLCWALLFCPAALVSYVHLLKALLKNSSQNPSSPRLGEGILILPDIWFREET